jgi:small subunit ribosomal protein S10
MASNSIRIRLKAFDHDIIDKSTRMIVETVLRTNAKIRGPIPLPTDKHRFTVIRGPHIDKDSREHFEMRIHKRLIDLHSPSEIVKQITSISIEPGVEVEVTIADID